MRKISILLIFLCFIFCNKNPVDTDPAKPLITVNPQSVTVNVGQNATFSVAATGTMPFTYKWHKNGGDIIVIPDSIYTTPATTMSDNGAVFRCIVSNSAGADTSDTAILTVNIKPMITGNPQPATVNVGQTATFGVVATGTKPFTYKWQKNDTDISGGTDSSYKTPVTVAGDSGSTYRCIVSNGAGSDTSISALLKVTTLPPEPVAYWDFNTVGGDTLYDITNNGNNGIIKGATWVTGIEGKALNFNGVSNYVEVAPGLNFSEFTYSAWFSLNSFPQSTPENKWYYEILSTIGTDAYCNSEIRVRHTNLEAQLATGTGIAWEFVSNGVETGNLICWYHIAATFDSLTNEMKIYLNGNLMNTVIGTGYAKTNTKMFIGARPSFNGNPSFFMDGKIDEVRIYNKALTESDIKEIYHQFDNTEINLCD